MDTNELLKLLDLNSQPPKPPDDALARSPLLTSITSSIPTTPPPKLSNPTALDVDAWGLRRGRDLLTESERLQKSGTDEFGAADFFCVAFDPAPQLLDSCVDDRRHEFLSRLLDTPEYHALHTATKLDDVASGIAAYHFAEQFAKLKQEEKDESKEKEDETPSEGNRGIPGSAGSSGEGDDLKREIATLRAVGKALAEAEKEVEELKETSAAMGMGPGEPGSNDPVAIAALFKRVRSDPALRKICDLAGRFRRVAQSKQRQKVSHGLDDVVGVEPGGEIGRLLPSELVKLVVPELELDTLRRIAERHALCREHHSVEPVGKGPIIISVDESGSMEGVKAHTAKALALALAWIARSQRRWCGLIAYSGESGERLLALPPGRWNESLLCDWLSEFIGKGSSLDVPVREMPDYYRRLGAPSGITDVILITDACCRIPADAREQFLAWKNVAKAWVITLVIRNSPGELAALSDEAHTVAALDPTSEAIGRVLSI